MSNITVTSENLSKFTKRLHKALAEYHATHSQAPTLSQTAELFARTLGAVNVHELQTLLNIPTVSFEEQWVTATEQTIRDYIQTTPQSKLKRNEISWDYNGDTIYLDLYDHKHNGIDEGEGVYLHFPENKKELKEFFHCNHIKNTAECFGLPSCDIDFLKQLEQSFPTNLIDNLKIVEFLKTHRNVNKNTPYNIVGRLKPALNNN